MKKPRVFSFTGKGGSGKTTLASLMLAAILRNGSFRDILVIDADPDANLSATLGIPVEATVGQAVDRRRNELKGSAGRGRKLRFSLWDTIRHDRSFDFLVMGRTAGEGCYCAVHSALTESLLDTMAMYDLVLMDFGAGLEHFSRRAGNPSDTLLISCDPSRLSFDTARRIEELVRELSLPYDRIYAVGSRFPRESEDLFFRLAREAGIEPLGVIPADDDVAARNLAGEDLLSLDPGNPALRAAESLFERLVASGPAS